MMKLNPLPSLILKGWNLSIPTTMNERKLARIRAIEHMETVEMIG